MAKGEIKPFVASKRERCLNSGDELSGWSVRIHIIYKPDGLHREETMINVHKTLLPLAFNIANLINYTQPIITVIKAKVCFSRSGYHYGQLMDMQYN